jgi:hypothetical protein
MTKQPDQPIKPGTSPGQMKIIDLGPLKDLLRTIGPPTFKGSKRRHEIGDKDRELCLMAGAEAWKRDPDAFHGQAHAITMAHAAYWEMELQADD